MPRIALTIAYDGALFHGWQIQHRERTVQGELERALKTITGHPLRVHGAGRTDAGVHALGQCAHFDPPPNTEHIPWVRALNATLPRDVRVTGARQAPPDFHARYSALDKTYAYTFCLARVQNPLRRGFSWHTGPLDRPAMDAAALAFTGTHDFRAFQNVGTPVEDTVRTIHEFTSAPSPFSGEIVFRVRANGFLKQMVRNLAGCLAAAGHGKVDPLSIRSLIRGRDRSESPPTAPAHGLCLETVRY